MRETSVAFEPGPAPEDVRAALERILASEAFRPSAQLQAFLRFVVETTLNGEAGRIRAFTIAVEAFGRDQAFNPQSDPIVRVEAARLRRAIAQYYEGPGANDPVEIVVPRGSYVPLFRDRTRGRETAPGAPGAALAPPAAKWRGLALAREHPRFAALALLFALATASGAIVLRQDGTPALESVLALRERGAPAARTRSPLPVVAFEPVAASDRELGAIRATLIDAFSRFDDIAVMADAAPSGASYRVSVTGERHADGAVVPAVRLTDSEDGTVVWTHGFARLAPGADLAAATESIASMVAPALAQPFGVIYAREYRDRARHGDGRYTCLLEAIEYRRTLDTSQHPHIRACLEATIRDDPAFPSAQAALAFLTLREFYAGQTRDPKALDDGLRLALRAVELRPASARAHHVLMNILFARGSVAEALHEGERAIALNPHDMTAFIGYGLRLAFAGRAPEGLEKLERAAKLSPVRPPVLEFALFLVTHALGDDKRAAHHASLLTDEIHPFVFIARALAAIRAGKREKAQQSIDRLFTLYPAWRIGPRREIERYLPAAGMVDRIMRELSPVGLVATN